MVIQYFPGNDISAAIVLMHLAEIADDYIRSELHLCRLSRSTFVFGFTSLRKGFKWAISLFLRLISRKTGASK